MPVQRPVRGFEVIFAQLHREMGPDVHAVFLEGEVSDERLRDAVYRALCRYPALRARILWPDGPGTRPIFEFPAPDRSGVRVETLSELPGEASLPLWHRAIERETERTFDPAAGFMFRVVRIPEETGCWLILAAHHACVDGNAMARVVHDVVEGCARGVEEEAAVAGPTPTVLDAVPAPFWKRWLTPVAVWFAARQRRGFIRHFPCTWIDRIPKERVGCTHSFAVGEPEGLSSLVERCRAEGVTVGSAFSAAAQLAILRCMRAWGSPLPLERGKIELELDVSYDLRHRVDPPLERNAVAMFVSNADINAHARPGTRFWDLARTLHEATRAQAGAGRPADFHVLLDGLFDLEATFGRYDLDYERTGGAASLIGVSNVGRYPFENPVDGLRIKRWFGLNRAAWGSTALICWIRSVDGRLMYTAGGLSPLFGRERMDAVQAEIVALLEGDCLDDPPVEA